MHRTCQFIPGLFVPRRSWPGADAVGLAAAPRRHSSDGEPLTISLRCSVFNSKNQ